MGLYDKLDKLKEEFLVEVDAILGGTDGMDARINIAYDIEMSVSCLQDEIINRISDLENAEEDQHPSNTEG